MTWTPVEVAGALSRNCAVKFSEAELAELTATIWENYRGRFDYAFGAEAEGFSEGAYCALPVASRGH